MKQSYFLLFISLHALCMNPPECLLDGQIYKLVSNTTENTVVLKQASDNHIFGLEKFDGFIKVTTNSLNKLNEKQSNILFKKFAYITASVHDHKQLKLHDFVDYVNGDFSVTFSSNDRRTQVHIYSYGKNMLSFFKFDSYSVPLSPNSLAIFINRFRNRKSIIH